MTLDLSQLHPLFRPKTLAQKKEEDKLKTWKAVFYTLRSLMWKEACQTMRREGLANGTLIYNIDGEVETLDGLTLLEYFDEMKPEFEESFDRAFAAATIDQMVEFSKTHFGKDFNALMKENDERMAIYRNRQSTNPIHQKPATDPVAEETKRKKKK